MECQTVYTLIRLILEEHYDHGLLCVSQYQELLIWYLSHFSKILNIEADRSGQTVQKNSLIRFGWLVVFEVNGPLRQYFSIYQYISPREREKEKRNDR